VDQAQRGIHLHRTRSTRIAPPEVKTPRSPGMSRVRGTAGPAEDVEGTVANVAAPGGPQASLPRCIQSRHRPDPVLSCGWCFRGVSTIVAAAAAGRNSIGFLPKTPRPPTATRRKQAGRPHVLRHMEPEKTCVSLRPDSRVHRRLPVSDGCLNPSHVRALQGGSSTRRPGGDATRQAVPGPLLSMDSCSSWSSSPRGRRGDCP